MINKANWTDFSSVDSSAALAKMNRVLPPWVSLLLVIVIGWQIGKIVWALVPAPAAGDPVAAPPIATATPGSGGARADVEAIAANHMFGEADAEAEPVVVPLADENLSDTRLTNLVLKGTIASAVPEFSVAVIADGTAEQKVYAIGDSLGSGTTLHAVYADRVVLNENGALTNLRLPSEFTSDNAMQVRRTTTTIRQSATPEAESSLRNVVTQNLTKLTDVIRPTPYLVDGQPAGYRVYPGRNKRQFAALGLRPGDLIMDINGQALTDPTQAMQIFESLGTVDEVTVTVERNGQAESLVLNTSQLDLDEESTE
ncbi:MAG: type II secretion system protein GspC [Woeseiaceae bacterium]|jgi:general secretion pathway protein C